MSEHESIVAIHTYSNIAEATTALNLVKEAELEVFFVNENEVGLNPLEELN